MWLGLRSTSQILKPGSPWGPAGQSGGREQASLLEAAARGGRALGRGAGGQNDGVATHLVMYLYVCESLLTVSAAQNRNR